MFELRASIALRQLSSCKSRFTLDGFGLSCLATLLKCYNQRWFEESFSDQEGTDRLKGLLLSLPVRRLIEIP
ncbi:unnamed protein product [Moneuplotes crassus]|uniref:Uncharacterized protein n=1 Tax=Euplotes crassus TaxID=5936 RepID=A0AAD1XYE1_EUPCR|nr:unnamed protein product [Moneuplotes crassus]